METRMQKIPAKSNPDIRIGVIPGHFATNHSHVNYYVDLTPIKYTLKTAKMAAEELASRFRNTPIDTVICLERTEVVGAFLAEALSSYDMMSINEGNDITVITPETDANNQMIFRDNTQKMVWNKHVLLLISSASTGKTIRRSLECLQYYSGILVGVAAMFSAAHEVSGIPIESIFTEDDLQDYANHLPTDCPQCKNGQKIDAIVNYYGYSKI